MDYATITFPTCLTLIRLIGAPVLLAPLLVQYLSSHHPRTVRLLTLLFVLFGITDFLDGYYARAWGQESFLGQLLDPIADKFLLCSVCIALVAVGRLWYGWALVFVSREFFVMGLREIALANGFLIPVAMVGKWKTFFQFAYLGMAIFATAPVPHKLVRWLEYALLFLAVLCTLASGWYYWMSFRAALLIA